MKLGPVISPVGIFGPDVFVASHGSRAAPGAIGKSQIIGNFLYDFIKTGSAEIPKIAAD